LLPVIARVQLGGGPAYYGILMSCVGGGAVAGAVLLPKLRGKFGTEGLMRSGMVVTIAALLALALVKDQVLAAVAMAVMGMAWISILTTANVAAQTALPDWVRGRGLAIYLTVFYGAMTAGSLIWGAVADSAGVPVSLLVAAGVGMASLVLAFFKPLPERELDLTPSMHWPEPAVSPEVLTEGEADRGPVLITVEYLVAPDRAPDFLAALREFKTERLRDGAFQWGVFEDTAQPGRFIEHFLVASWLEHQRQHRRVSKTDAELQAQLSRFHRGDGPPKVEHFIAPRTVFFAS
jgi:MFS family permease